jgi:hypothetical protein
VRKRKLVDEVRGEWDVSIRRACRMLLFDTSSYHYKSRRPAPAVLEQRIKEICQTRVRYGYRRARGIELRKAGTSEGRGCSTNGGMVQISRLLADARQSSEAAEVKAGRRPLHGRLTFLKELV